MTLQESHSHKGHSPDSGTSDHGPTYRKLQAILETSGSPLSPEAEEKMNDYSAHYGRDLVLEAARLARRENLQQIGLAHVEDAKNRLFSIDRRSWFKRTCGSFGGTLLGIGTAPILSHLNGVATTSSLIAAGAVALVLGTAMVMYGVRR